MSNWSTRILDLLGRTEKDPVSIKFLSDLSLMNSPAIRAESPQQFTFSELGVSMYAFDGRFFSAQFHIAPTSTADGSATLPYVNDLPFGLTGSQTRDSVHHTLGPPHQINRVTGIRSDYFRSESYKLEKCEATFWYSLPGERLDTVIVFVDLAVLEMRHSSA